MSELSRQKEVPWATRIGELLLPILRHRIERLGVQQSGAYEFYDVRVQRGDMFLDYELALASKLIGGDLNVQSVHEIGCGFGQLMFLLGWNGFKTFGVEVDKGRVQTARMLREVLALTDPELTMNISLLEGEFPVGEPPEPGQRSLLLTTNVVATRTTAQQLAILQQMRRYPLVISDVQRFFHYRSNAEEEALTLGLFAQAGFGEPKLFLDLGASGKYYLFDNSYCI